MSGYAACCFAAISGPPYSAGFEASFRSGRMETNSGGFSVSVVMSWIIGTPFAIRYQFPGTPNAAAPKSIPAIPRRKPRRRLPGRATIPPAAEIAVPTAPK